MNRFKLYEHVLTNLATQGNPEAKLCLELAEKLSPEPASQSMAMAEVARHLRFATESCGAALVCNNTWTYRTDDHIRQALSHINEAMAGLVVNP